MIPKKIHYVWVGHNPKSPLIKECLTTWKKKLPDYEIIEWNESNFDMHENRYLEEAYQAKKWAFVSDYIRARAIYEQGGIYLDTDVRVLKKLDPLLKNQAFIGFENNDYLSAAIFGAEAYHPFIKDILDWQQIIEDDTGTKPTRAVCNRKTFSYIMANEGIRKSIYPANNGIGLITEAVIKDFIFQATGIDVVIYTKKYIDEAGVTKQYIADDTFVMFPEGSLGNTWFGTTPEESDLRTSKVANVDITDTGVAVTTIQKADPVTVETKVSMICLPSFERADQVLIADVTPE